MGGNGLWAILTIIIRITDVVLRRFEGHSSEISIRGGTFSGSVVGEPIAAPARGRSAKAIGHVVFPAAATYRLVGNVAKATTMAIIRRFCLFRFSSYTICPYLRRVNVGIAIRPRHGRIRSLKEGGTMCRCAARRGAHIYFCCIFSYGNIRKRGSGKDGRRYYNWYLSRHAEEMKLR